MKAQEQIVIRGARTHNLKNIEVVLPRGKLIVFTGLSGSGKSSLAFDTIFAEGQRRYVESLSAYARQFLEQLQKPDVDEISGLSPAISIDQKTRSSNPRSTVATVTEIYDYLRVLFARVGQPHCIVCGREIKKLSVAEITALVRKQMTEEIHRDKTGTVLKILSPLVLGRKGEYYQLLYDLLERGFREVLVDGVFKQLRERIILAKYKKHDIDVVVDSIPIKDFQLGKKMVKELRETLTEAAEERLTEGVERALEESDGLVKVIIGQETRIWSTRFACPYDGFSYPEVEPRLFSFNSPHGACPECHGLGTVHLFGEEVCPVCRGRRLRPEALNVLLVDKNIAAVSSMTVLTAHDFFLKLKLSEFQAAVAKPLLKEIVNRLQFLLDVGLDYLTLDRRANTLSGGESQRIRLASQLGSQLVGALYVLDEPTIGLHQHDNERLIKTLLRLRDLGNTVIVVEHDPDTIYSSDYLVDLGPGAGIHGGNVVVTGETDKLLMAEENNSGSLTLAYLRGEQAVPVQAKRREADKGVIKIRGASIFNLKDLNIDLPLGRLLGITGVSGSGKSTLLYEVLYKNLRARYDRRYRSNDTFHCREFVLTEPVHRAILVDQTAIGRTPRSNPATYTNTFTFIRDLFAASEAARIRGWGPSRFSFNVKGGRCEACSGNGVIAVEMHFLPTVYVECDVCRGRRFQKETLQIKYKNRNISEVLKMTVEEALDFFADIPPIFDRLNTLSAVGLQYLELGQPSNTLSGGEAQRVKISAELYRPFSERTIYLLDEPTVGLHFEDIKNLVTVLHRLVDRGNTVVVIEHNMDIIKNCDYLIDLGPGGGERGGTVVACGTPEAVARQNTYTAKYLRRLLKKS